MKLKVCKMREMTARRKTLSSAICHKAKNQSTVAETDGAERERERAFAF